MDYTNSVMQTLPPKTLYHYTSPTGLLGIVNTKKIWATHSKFLNDTNELRHSEELVRSYIRSILDLKHSNTNLNNEDRILLEEVNEEITKSKFHSFLISLSTEPDLLSQWRGYSPSGGGYSIGFPTSRLISILKSQGFILTPCVYNDKIKGRIIEEIISHHLTMFDNLKMSQPENDCKSVIATVKKKFIYNLAMVGLILKHDTFKEENEWRIISDPLKSHHVQEKIQFRGGQKSIIPYIELNIQDIDEPMLEPSDPLFVCAGPSENIEQSWIAIDFLLHKMFKGVAWACKSRIPYRNFS